MRSRFLLLVVLVLSLDSATAFTPTKKHDRTSKRPAFTGVTQMESDAAAPVPHSSPPQHQSATAAFGMHPSVAVNYELMDEDDDDDDLIGVGTAVISCLLSVALGFGLGYGT